MLPAALIQSLKGINGFDEDAFIAVHESAAQVTSVRLNPKKIFNIQSSIFNPQLEKIPWSQNGYYLAARPSFTLDPLFHAGAYYVQEASSMFLEEVMRRTVDLSQSLKVLDLCAAPGGKSTLLQSILSPESMLVSNEVIKSRVNILTENITKWGAANVVVTNNDPQHFQKLAGYFDVIVVDAPCSGSGLFRKDEAAIDEWSEENVMLCSRRQQRILADVLPALKNGGILIYSTCSYSADEDEAICKRLINEHGLDYVQLQLDENWKITAGNDGMGCRFYPYNLKGEGFFIAAFRKQSKDETTFTKPLKQKRENPAAKDLEILNEYLQNPADFSFIKINDEYIAIPVAIEKELPALQQSLYIKKAGIKIGSIAKAQLLPAHELAVSFVINKNIPTAELDKETALQYLRREEIQISTALKGWVLMNYNGHPLGWAKILPNRVNNYYPKEWRILNK